MQSYQLVPVSSKPAAAIKAGGPEQANSVASAYPYMNEYLTAQGNAAKYFTAKAASLRPEGVGLPIGQQQPGTNVAAQRVQNVPSGGELDGKPGTAIIQQHAYTRKYPHYADVLAAGGAAQLQVRTVVPRASPAEQRQQQISPILEELPATASPLVGRASQSPTRTPDQLLTTGSSELRSPQRSGFLTQQVEQISLSRRPTDADVQAGRAALDAASTSSRAATSASAPQPHQRPQQSEGSSVRMGMGIHDTRDMRSPTASEYATNSGRTGVEQNPAAANRALAPPKGTSVLTKVGIVGAGLTALATAGVISQEFVSPKDKRLSHLAGIDF